MRRQPPQARQDTARTPCTAPHCHGLGTGQGRLRRLQSTAGKSGPRRAPSQAPEPPHPGIAELSKAEGLAPPELRIQKSQDGANGKTCPLQAAPRRGTALRHMLQCPISQQSP